MKTQGIAGAILAGFLLVGCGPDRDRTAGDYTRDGREAGAGAMDGTSDRMADTRAALNRRAEQLDRRIDELAERTRERSNQMSRDARQEADRTLARLREESAEVRSKLSRMGDSAEDGWERFKSETEQALDRAERSVENAWNDLTD
ncbi:MAG: hypothetical protein KIT09_08875 [Bryobacteraceae bacterium]|nr:hypothetical protein [Bryobacteraceae bacterium]